MLVHRTSRRSWSQCAVIVLAAAAALGGCRDVLGVDGYGTYPPCQPCMDAQCAVEEAGCAAEPACHALEECLAKCHRNDDACRVTCNLSIRRTTEMSRVIECAARSCDQCAVAHATFGGLECTQCLKREAPESLKAFSRSIPALELEACQQDCSPGFADECLCTDLPSVEVSDGGREGAALLSSLRHLSTCSTECTQTVDWSCLGKVRPIGLSTSAQALQLHVRLAPYEETINPMDSHDGGGPLGELVGAEVTACAGGECTDVPPRSDHTKAGTGAFLSLEPLRTGDYFGDLTVRWNEEDTALLPFFPQLRRSPSWTWRRVVSRNIAQVLVDGFYGRHVPLDWEMHGGIIWSVAGCNGVPAEGVTATLKPPEGVETTETTDVLVYVKPSFLLYDDPPVTSHVGLGAVISAVPGTRHMVLERRSDGMRIGTYDFRVVAGAVTVLSFAPFEP